MKGTLRKVMGMLLAVSMLITLMPAGALADEFTDGIPAPEAVEPALEAELPDEETLPPEDDTAAADAGSDYLVSENHIPVLISEGTEVTFSNDTIPLLTEVEEGSEYIGDYTYYSVEAGDYMMEDTGEGLSLCFTVTANDTVAPKVSVLTQNGAYGDKPDAMEYAWEEAEAEEAEAEEANEYALYLSYDSCKAVRIEALPLVNVSFKGFHAEIWSEDGDILSQAVYRSGDAIRFFIQPDDDYKIQSVESSDSENTALYDEDSAMWLLRPVSDCDITAYAVPTDRIVHFHVSPGAGELSVQLYEGVTKDPNDENTYLVPYNVEGIEFRISTSDGSRPSVYFEDMNSAPKALAPGYGENPFEYFIYWSDLPTETSVIISKPDVEGTAKTVTFSFPGDRLESLSLSNQGTECLPVGTDESEGIITNTYEIPFGSAPVLSVEMKDVYQAGYLSIKKSGNNNLINLCTRHAFSRTIPVLGDVNATLYPVERLWIRVSKKDAPDNYLKGTEYAAYNGIKYALEEGEYSAEIMMGNDPAEEYTYRLSALKNNDSFSDGVINITVDPDNDMGQHQRTYTVSTQKAGATIEIDGKPRKITQTYRITINPVLKVTSIRVSSPGLKDSEPLKKRVDSRTVFKIMANRSPGQNASSLRAGLSNLNLTVAYEGAEQQIPKDRWTDIKKGEDVIASVYYESNGLRAELITGAYKDNNLSLKFSYGDSSNVLKEIPVQITEDTKAQNTKPAVKVKSTTDSSIVLEFSDIDTASPCLGKAYYKVVAESDNSLEIGNMLNGEKTWYIEREYPELLDYGDAETGDEIAAIDKKNEKIQKAFRQTVRLSMVQDEEKDGAESSYKLKISCVNTLPGKTLDLHDEDSSKILTSGPEENLTASTKDALYTAKVSLKKGKTGLYAGEKNVNIALVQFDKTATCLGAEACDTSYDDTRALTVSFDPVTGKLFADSTDETAVGKHVIRVMPTVRDNIYQAGTTLTVTVYRSIDSLAVIPASTEYVKAKNKTLTFKVSVKYNPESGIKPKTSRVTYSVIDAADEEEDPADDEDRPPYTVTVKNGKVTVSKYQGSASDETEGAIEDYSFRIVAKAADYPGNPTTGISEPITIKTEKRTIGTAVLLLKQEDGSYKRAADSTEKTVKDFTTDEIDGAVFAVALPDTKLKESYKPYELPCLFTDPDLLTYSVSKKKALDVFVLDNRIDPKRAMIFDSSPANNVVLKAVTKDGGKQSASVRFNIVYEKPEVLEAGIGDAKPSGKSFSVTGDGNNYVFLSLYKKDSAADTDWKELSGQVNYRISVKGGKFVSKNHSRGYYGIHLTSGKATVTLTYKGKKNVYTITDSAYDAYKNNTITAKPANSLISNLSEDQTLQINLRSGKYDFTGKYLLIKADTPAYNTNPSAYSLLLDAIGATSSSYIKERAVELTDTAKGKGTASLIAGGKELVAGSYKLVAYCVEKDGDTYSAPLTKPVRFTLKVTAPKKKKGSFKPAVTYTINTAESGSVELEGRGTNIKEVSFNEAYNGYDAGRSNGFLKYFEFVPTDDTDGENPVPAVIRLRDDLTEGDIAFLKTKASAVYRTGYVKYYAAFGDDGYGRPLTEIYKTVKITIVVK
ncbi:MAG: hypothetical protein K6F53_07055 [Lachnospiraceae bacterium]|nr:hypothetical protein [Lachnospiraceae bacterium]